MSISRSMQPNDWPSSQLNGIQGRTTCKHRLSIIDGGYLVSAPSQWSMLAHWRRLDGFPIMAGLLANSGARENAILDCFKWTFLLRQYASFYVFIVILSLPWRHNERDGASYHRRLDWFRNRLFKHKSTKTLKPCVAGICEMFRYDDVIIPTANDFKCVKVQVAA